MTPSPRKATDEEAAESKDMEAEMSSEATGAYGMGQYTRQRAPEVQFRVGDVVLHEKYEIRGVIIGWDPHAMAPEDRLKEARKENEHLSTQPNYAILIDTRDRLTPQMSYVVQESLVLDKGTIWHPLLEKFFDGYDEDRQKYVMRPVYKKWYPDD
uniref:YccV-like domain-containing protein n=1 Tax=Caenorhabditis tropicalis TaxID=1561998 RepID=A0A1I7TBS0_9PELO